MSLPVCQVKYFSWLTNGEIWSILWLVNSNCYYLKGSALYGRENTGTPAGSGWKSRFEAYRTDGGRPGAWLLRQTRRTSMLWQASPPYVPSGVCWRNRNGGLRGQPAKTAGNWLRAIQNRRILQGGCAVKQHRFWAWGAVICMIMVIITGYKHK